MKKWMGLLALGLTPIVFLPVTQDFYDTNKLALLAGVASVLSLFSGVEFLIHKKPPTVHAPAGVIAFGGLLVASLVSLIAASTSKIDALMHPLGLASVLSLTIILSVLSRPSDELKTRLTWILLTGSSVLGLITIYQFVGMGRVMFPGIPFLQNALWTPAGTTTTAIAVFAVAISLALTRIRATIDKPNTENSLIFYIGTLLITGLGGILSLIQLIPTIPTSVIPVSAAWAIAIHVLNQTKTLIAGTGAENFVSAFTLGKPVSLETTGLWNMRFGVNANFFLHMATIYGAAGLAASLVFVWQCIKNLRHVLPVPAAVFALSLFIVPPTLTVLTVGAVLLVISTPQHLDKVKPLPSWTRYFFGLFLFLAGAGGLYAVGRAYLGELEYFTALTAVEKNEGTNAYNRHRAAIRTNPYVARYHITLSQINMSLANSEATKHKELAGQLVQEAISEAKIAVSLNPQSVTGWENLGVIYQALMPVAKGADAWALASYQKALSLDPTNPVLMVNIGRVFVQEARYDDAIVLFKRAISLRPDYSAAADNLKNAYKLKGDTTTPHE